MDHALDDSAVLLSALFFHFFLEVVVYFARPNHVLAGGDTDEE